MKKLIVDSYRCTGCHQCELACSFRKLRKFSPCDSRIQIDTWEDRCVSIPVVCMQCSDAPCERACPVDAIHMDPNTGAYKVDEDLCIGCDLCTKKCPIAAIVTDRYSDKAVKCDLCDGNPACVAVCASGALKYADIIHARAGLRLNVTAQIKASLTGEGVALPSGLTKLGGAE